MRSARLLLLVAVVGCGGEEEDAPPPKQPQGAGGAKAPAPPPPAAAPAPLAGGRIRIEDRVTSATEKERIRRKFRESDFAATLDNRDPFMSFVINQPGLEGDTTKPAMEIDKLCTRPDQFVAQTFSYQDLKLVGIITLRAQRRALMMDPGNIGQTVKKGDCVGREKALVQDIGDGFITFAVRPEIAPNGEERAMTEESKYLRPGKFEVTSQPATEESAPAKPSVPVVAPPAAEKR